MSVIIFADQFQEKVKKSALEAVQYGSRIAQQLGVPAIAVAVGEVDGAELSALGQYGASKVLHVADARLNEPESGAVTKVMAEAVAKENGSVIVFSHNFAGRSIAPQLSARLKAGFVAGAIGLPDTAAGFVVKKNVFSGKAFANVSITTDKKIVSVMPNTFSVSAGSGTANVEAFSAGLTDADYRIKTVKVETVSGEVPLTEAEIVVSGGRGLKGPENWGSWKISPMYWVRQRPAAVPWRMPTGARIMSTLARPVSPYAPTCTSLSVSPGLSSTWQA